MTVKKQRNALDLLHHKKDSAIPTDSYIIIEYKYVNNG